jgi:flagellar protein FlaI
MVKQTKKTKKTTTKSGARKSSQKKTLKKSTSTKKKRSPTEVKKRLEACIRKETKEKIMDKYEYLSEDIPITITIRKEQKEFIPLYDIELSAISKTTELMLERVRQELIKKVNLGIADLNDIKKTGIVEDRFEELISILINKYFPDSDMETSHFLSSYLKIQSLGLGKLELIMSDQNLEEIVINQAAEPVWVYHKKYGWLKTNIFLEDEEEIKHYASIIGRRVGRQISVLAPLLDAHIGAGDRVNATLNPVSTQGNTITIRKFSRDPWTITKFLNTKTISTEAAALIWSAIQYELSTLIAGGTASGKTSALNVFASFFPPNQRIISIEDTREIRLPKFLHWVPLNTMLPNAEAKGKIDMGQLLVNSLRMRPDRILVGEVRRKQETETLFEAIHTGHSVYATFHANNAQEAVDRLTNPPLDVPKIMLPAISLVVVQFRNRRSGMRRTFQIAEITPKGDATVIMQYSAKKDVLEPVSKSLANSHFYTSIKNVTGMTNKEIDEDHEEKVAVLQYLMEHDISSVDGVGRIMAEYYTDKDTLMCYVEANEKFPL